jgi:hypothetical protein
MGLRGKGAGCTGDRHVRRLRGPEAGPHPVDLEGPEPGLTRAGGGGCHAGAAT